MHIEFKGPGNREGSLPTQASLPLNNNNLRRVKNKNLLGVFESKFRINIS